ncbi:MAG TPA: hypothetical protein GX532_02685, partial [Clostridia bacterium]|nr:hypothetical protein [Clostridia bacterium]
IVANINPYGKEPEIQENWEKPIDFIKQELQTRGIAIDEYGHSREMREIWIRVNEQMKQERNERRTLAQFCAHVQTSEKTEETLQKEEPPQDRSVGRDR